MIARVTSEPAATAGQTAADAGAHPPAIRSTSPSLPRTLWQAWNEYARRGAAYQAELLLSLVYFVVLGPSALIGRLTGASFQLDLGARPRKSYWVERRPVNRTLADMERQF
jgi:hypothetical protein